MQCRAANSRYSCERDRARRQNGDCRAIVDAAKSRAHIIKLGNQGVGYKIVAEEAGIGHTIALEIRTGKRLRIRANTARAILAVNAATVVRGDKSLIDAGPTWKLLKELLGRGYTRTQLAKWLGSTAKYPALQVRRDVVTYRTAFAVRQLYDKIEAGLMRRDR
ncbi:MAG: hypothetical protein EPO02_12870 [Nitrospirae bacterium]|nr:MAG: hypothetical protein EPO02_12870 [Nitrospirota bacterium]